MSSVDQGGSKASFVAEVESLRGIAALCVAIGHTHGMTVASHFASKNEVAGLDDFAEAWFGLRIPAHAAVVVFFVISGFVLGRSLSGVGSGGTISQYASFMWRRIWRIFPAHVVALMFIVPASMLLLAQHSIDLSAFPFLNLLPQYHLQGTAFTQVDVRLLVKDLCLATNRYNAVTWSLTVEMLMCLWLPFLYLIAKRNMLLLDFFVVVGFGVVTWLWNPHYADDFYFLLYVPAFYLGLLVERRGMQWADRISALFGNRDRAIAASYLAVSLAGLLNAVDSALSQHLVALGTFGLVSLLVHARGSRIAAILRHPALRWNGRISYSFYLWHWTLLVLILRLAYEKLPPAIILSYNTVFFLVVLLVTIALALAIAHISFHCIERPCIRFGRQVWRTLATFTLSVRRLTTSRHDVP